MFKALRIITIITVVNYLMIKPINYYLADIYSVLSKKSIESANTKKALSNINTAIKLNSNEPSYHISKAAYLYLDNLLIDENKHKNVLEELNIALKLNTNNLATLRNSIGLYYLVSKNNTNNLKTTQEYYNNLLQSYPNDLGLRIQIYKYQKKLNLFEDAKENYLNIQQLRPDIVNWHKDLITHPPQF